MYSKWKPDAYSQLDTWIHNWEPLTKNLAALAFIIGVVSLQSIKGVGISLGIILLTVISSRMPFSFVLRRLSWVLPFILLMLITLSLGGGWPISIERFTFGALISLKALTSVLVMILVMGTQPLPEYLYGLARMGLPSVLITILFLAYRYVFLFKTDLQSTQRSLRARNFKGNLTGETLKTYGEMAGGMMLRAIDRSETVYQAMAARGFDGRLRTYSSRTITLWDVVKGLGGAIVVILIVLMERMVLV